MKHKAEDIESYETKKEDVESYGTKNKGHWVLWNIKHMTLSPIKLKRRGRWVLLK